MKAGAWFGSTLAGSQSTLYCCGFRDGFDEGVGGNRGAFHSGTCYTVAESGAIRKHITFIKKKTGRYYRPQYNYSPKRSVWKLTGRYAFSATVDDNDKLIVGAPAKGFDRAGYNAKPWKSTGSLGLIQKQNFLKHPVKYNFL